MVCMLGGVKIRATSNVSLQPILRVPKITQLHNLKPELQGLRTINPVKIHTEVFRVFASMIDLKQKTKISNEQMTPN